MNRSLVLLVTLAGLLPLGVEAPFDTGTGAPPPGTRLRVGGGVGYYAFVTRGCDGNVVDEVPVRFRDGSVSLEHRFATVPLALGVRGGWTRDRIDSSSRGVFANLPVGRTVSNRYVNPFFVLDTGPQSIGLGYVFHEAEFITAGEGAREQQDHPMNDISFHFRIGRFDDRYFLVQWMEGEPLYSGGGYLTAGVGGPAASGRFHGLLGLGAGGPYEGAGPLARASFELAPGMRIHAAGHVTLSGTSVPWGASLGVELHRSSGSRGP